jgi:hypothetical protein
MSHPFQATARLCPIAESRGGNPKVTSLHGFVGFRLYHPLYEKVENVKADVAAVLV